MNILNLFPRPLADLIVRTFEPTDEIAYEYGYRSMQMNDPEHGADNPYQPGTRKYRSWKKGADFAVREELRIW